MTQLDELRIHLGITYQDDDTDNDLMRLIDQGVDYIDNIAGGSLDYDSNGRAKALLFDYVMYARSGARDEFMTNYRKELQSLQISERVKEYANKKETTNSD